MWSGWRSASWRQIHRKRKGRVERNNGVHQDRLVKSSAQGIQDYEAANAYFGSGIIFLSTTRRLREKRRDPRTPTCGHQCARLREVFRFRDGTMDQQRLGGAYAGIFCSSSRRIGVPGRHGKALICEWRMEQSRCATGMNASSTRSGVAAERGHGPKARPHREPATRKNQPAPNHPWRERHAERRKQAVAGSNAMSALIGASASASP